MEQHSKIERDKFFSKIWQVSSSHTKKIVNFSKHYGKILKDLISNFFSQAFAKKSPPANIKIVKLTPERSNLRQHLKDLISNFFSQAFAKKSPPANIKIVKLTPERSNLRQHLKDLISNFFSQAFAKKSPPANIKIVKLIPEKEKSHRVLELFGKINIFSRFRCDPENILVFLKMHWKMIASILLIFIFCLSLGIMYFRGPSLEKQVEQVLRQDSFFHKSSKLKKLLNKEEARNLPAFVALKKLVSYPKFFASPQHAKKFWSFLGLSNIESSYNGSLKKTLLSLFQKEQKQIWGNYQNPSWEKLSQRDISKKIVDLKAWKSHWQDVSKKLSCPIEDHSALYQQWILSHKIFTLIASYHPNSLSNSKQFWTQIESIQNNFPQKKLHTSLYTKLSDLSETEQKFIKKRVEKWMKQNKWKQAWREMYSWSKHWKNLRKRNFPLPPFEKLTKKIQEKILPNLLSNIEEFIKTGDIPTHLHKKLDAIVLKILKEKLHLDEKAYQQVWYAKDLNNKVKRCVQKVDAQWARYSKWHKKGYLQTLKQSQTYYQKRQQAKKEWQDDLKEIIEKAKEKRRFFSPENIKEFNSSEMWAFSFQKWNRVFKVLEKELEQVRKILNSPIKNLSDLSSAKQSISSLKITIPVYKKTPEIFSRKILKSIRKVERIRLAEIEKLQKIVRQMQKRKHSDLENIKKFWQEWNQILVKIANHQAIDHSCEKQLEKLSSVEFLTDFKKFTNWIRSPKKEKPGEWKNIFNELLKDYFTYYWKLNLCLNDISKKRECKETLSKIWSLQEFGEQDWFVSYLKWINKKIPPYLDIAYPKVNDFEEIWEVFPPQKLQGKLNEWESWKVWNEEYEKIWKSIGDKVKEKQQYYQKEIQLIQKEILSLEKIRKRGFWCKEKKIFDENFNALQLRLPKEESYRLFEEILEWEKACQEIQSDCEKMRIDWSEIKQILRSPLRKNVVQKIQARESKINALFQLCARQRKKITKYREMKSVCIKKIRLSEINKLWDLYKSNPQNLIFGTKNSFLKIALNRSKKEKIQQALVLFEREKRFLRQISVAPKFESRKKILEQMQKAIHIFEEDFPRISIGQDQLKKLSLFYSNHKKNWCLYSEKKLKDKLNSFSCQLQWSLDIQKNKSNLEMIEQKLGKGIKILEGELQQIDGLNKIANHHKKLIEEKRRKCNLALKKLEDFQDFRNKFQYKRNIALKELKPAYEIFLEAKKKRNIPCILFAKNFDLQLAKLKIKRINKSQGKIFDSSIRLYQQTWKKSELLEDRYKKLHSLEEKSKKLYRLFCSELLNSELKKENIESLYQKISKRFKRNKYHWYLQNSFRAKLEEMHPRREIQKNIEVNLKKLKEKQQNLQNIQKELQKCINLQEDRYLGLRKKEFITRISKIQEVISKYSNEINELKAMVEFLKKYQFRKSLAIEKIQAFYEIYRRNNAALIFSSPRNFRSRFKKLSFERGKGFIGDRSLKIYNSTYDLSPHLHTRYQKLKTLEKRFQSILNKYKIFKKLTNEELSKLEKWKDIRKKSWYLNEAQQFEKQLFDIRIKIFENFSLQKNLKNIPIQCQKIENEKKAFEKMPDIKVLKKRKKNALQYLQKKLIEGKKKIFDLRKLQKFYPPQISYEKASKLRNFQARFKFSEISYLEINSIYEIYTKYPNALIFHPIRNFYIYIYSNKMCFLFKNKYYDPSFDIFKKSWNKSKILKKRFQVLSSVKEKAKKIFDYHDYKYSVFFDRKTIETRYKQIHNK